MSEVNGSGCSAAFSTLLMRRVLFALIMQGPVAVGITRMGTRVTFRMDELQRMLAALVTSGAGMIPPECRDLVLLQSTGKRFMRMVAADVSLEATPAGSHVVSDVRYGKHAAEVAT